MRYLACIVVVLAAACSSADLPTAPTETAAAVPPVASTSPIPLAASHEPAGTAEISCPHDPPRILYAQGSRSSIQVHWIPIRNIDTYQVALWYSRDGATPFERLRFFPYDPKTGSNGEIELHAPHVPAGRYRIELQTKTRCDTFGRTATDTAIVDGPDEGIGRAPSPYCYVCHQNG
jgi:hypothetical protein